jgi:16S rRNA (cytosine1407-C5)-methyltransferase
MSDGLPARFTERLKAILPPERLAGVLASFQGPRAAGFRINALRAEPEAVLAELRDLGLTPAPLPWFPLGFTVPAEQREALVTSAAWEAGRIYIQNPSSMVPPLVLDPRPGEQVLDLAAAPGGKTLQLAARMQNRGRIAAVEAVKGRFHKLRANLARHGAEMVVPYQADGTRLWRKVEGRFDRVLLDAPCSSESRFRSDQPQTYAYWSEKKVREMARRQKQLLYSAIRCLKPGGTLVYSTCAFAPEENEQVVARQLENFPGELSVAPVEAPFPNAQPGLTRWAGRDLPPELAGALRILPEAAMAGFFVCKLRRRGG